MVKSRRYGDHGPEAAGVGERQRCCARCRCSTGCSLPICRLPPRKCGRGGRPARCIARHGRRSPRSTASAAADPEARRALDAAIDVLGEIRRVKSIEKRPLKARIDVAAVRWSEAAIGLLQQVEVDLRTRRRRRAVRVSAGRRSAVDDVDVRARGRRRSRRAARMKQVPFEPLDPGLYREIVRRALAEDLGWGDVTTEATVPPELRARGIILGEVALRHRRRRGRGGGVPAARSRGRLHRASRRRRALRPGRRRRRGARHRPRRC